MDFTDQNNKKVFFSIIGGGVLLLGFFGWLIYNDWNAMEATEKEKASLDSQVKQARAEIAQIPNIEEKILILRERVKRSAAVLPDDAEIHAFVDQMTAFATDSGVIVTKLDDKDAKRRTGGAKGRAKDAFDRVSYKLSIDGTFDEFLRFIDSFENKYARFVRVVSMNIRAERKSLDGVIKPHKIDLEIETYVYNAKGKNQLVVVPGEEQKLERIRLAGKLDHEVENLDVYQLASSNLRRDPFVDPRQSRPDPAAGELLAEQQQAVLLDFLRRLREAQDEIRKEPNITHLVKRIIQEEKNNRLLVSLRSDVGRALEERVFSVPDISTRFQSDVADPFAILIRDRNLERGGGSIPVEELEGELAKMKRALTARRFSEVIALYEGFREIRPRAGTEGPIAEFFARMEPLHQTAKTHIEAQSLSLKIGGIIVSDKNPSGGIVIINERSYGPGDQIKEGLELRSVSSTEVVFDYRGIEVVRHVSEGKSRFESKK